MEAQQHEFANAQRGHKGSYRAKFHALRDRFASSIAAKEQSERNLVVALQKKKALEDECNLLLDVLGRALADDPEINRNMTLTPPLMDPPPPSSPTLAKAAQAIADRSRSEKQKQQQQQQSAAVNGFGGTAAQGSMRSVAGSMDVDDAQMVNGVNGSSSIKSERPRSTFQQ